MDLTPRQIQGLEIAVDRFYKGEKYSVISGYAGTGKSTLVQHIIAALDVSQKDVIYCSYTGKATLVLSRKGCKNTATLHKLLYKARLNPRTGKFSFHPKSVLDYPFKIVVVDEVSMLSAELWKLLQSHPVYVLALGDPGQLGPIKSDLDSGLLQNPHIFLNKIMRQAQDNEIIKLSMDIRSGKPLQPFDGEHVKIISADEVSTGMYSWSDQILCAMNKTRHHINREMRKIEGRDESPEIGDKIICLHNYWDVFSSEELDPLVNGTLGWITYVEKAYNSRVGKDVLWINFETEVGDHFNNIQVDYKMLTTGEPSFTTKQLGEMFRKKVDIPRSFAFGSAITTWKAQGSEWDNVLLFEEAFPYKADEHRRYLYTGVTRASEKIVVVKK